MGVPAAAFFTWVGRGRGVHGSPIRRAYQDDPDGGAEAPVTRVDRDRSVSRGVAEDPSLGPGRASHPYRVHN
jgi:hypothetical protein